MAVVWDSTIGVVQFRATGDGRTFGRYSALVAPNPAPGGF
jgi:hypothetical protein